MKRSCALMIGLLLTGSAAFQFPNAASAQDAGWVTVVDGTRMGDWDHVGTAN